MEIFSGLFINSIKLRYNAKPSISGKKKKALKVFITGKGIAPPAFRSECRNDVLLSATTSLLSCSKETGFRLAPKTANACSDKQPNNLNVSAPPRILQPLPSRRRCYAPQTLVFFSVSLL